MIKFDLGEGKLSKLTQKKKKNVSLKPDLFKHDIDPEKNLEVDKIEVKLTFLFNKLQNIKPQDFNISHDYGEVNILKDIMCGIHDNHEIILEISRKYSPSKLINSNLKLPTQNRQSKILCLIPLVRTQVESIYTIILLFLKQNKMFKKFIESSWKNNYAIEIYQIKECKALKRFASKLDKKHEELRNLILNKKYQQHFKKILIKKDLIKIENQVNQGNFENIEKFPGPLKAIRELIKGNNNNPPIFRSKLIKVLKKIYVRYIRLCLYLHGSEMHNFAGRSLRTGEINLVKKLNENVLEGPLRELDYLSMAIIFTIFYGYIKQPIEILINLSELWKDIENYSLLGKFTWDTWAKKVFGQI